MSPGQFFQSYLLAYLFWLGAALGGLALLMLQHLSGGAWGVVLRRIFEAAARTLPWMALFFVPLVFGMPRPLPLDRHGRWWPSDHILQEKALYLNVPFFLVRAVIYFVVWIGLAFALTSWSAEQDRTGDPALAVRMRTLSAGGLVVYALTMTFAVDRLGDVARPALVLDDLRVPVRDRPGAHGRWRSPIVMAWRLSAEAPMSGVYNAGHFHDLGKLLLAFVMLWAYLSFSQFLIIWSANLPEEIPWYLHRLNGGWECIGIGLVVFHFAVPFVAAAVAATRSATRRLLAGDGGRG